jgi:ABC-type antimicrobial peptide transport system permease subunit
VSPLAPPSAGGLVEVVDVVRWVSANGMKPVLVGLVAGLAGAVTVATALRSVLFQISPFDPLALGAVVAALVIASGAACYLPARRAAAPDPMLALRQ